MELLVKIATIWLALDLMIVATIWYATNTLQVVFPNWWKAVVCDYAPETFD